MSPHELTDRNQEILRLYADTAETLETIGRRFGVSRQRVHQIVSGRANASERRRQRNLSLQEPQTIATTEPSLDAQA